MFLRNQNEKFLSYRAGWALYIHNCFDTVDICYLDIILHFHTCVADTDDYHSSILFLKIFIYFWMFWVFASVPGLSLLVVCVGFSPWSASSRHWSFSSCSAWACGVRCPEACVIYSEQGLKLCPLHWQMGS